MGWFCRLSHVLSWVPGVVGTRVAPNIDVVEHNRDKYEKDMTMAA